MDMAYAVLSPLYRRKVNDEINFFVLERRKLSIAFKNHPLPIDKKIIRLAFIKIVY